MHVSRELQETIVSALMKNSYLLSICRSEMNEGYFSDPCCKVIYKALVTYYNKYQNMPRLNELLIIVDEVYYPTCGVNLSEVKDTCCRLDKYSEPDEVFIKNKITDFIRKIRSTNAIKSFLEVCKNSPNLEGEEFVSDLIKALEVQLSTTRVFSMTDPEQVREVRSASVGGSDQSKIIRTHYESLNKCLMFGGWQPSTVNMVVGPPNCLVGSTKIMTLDGNSHTLEEMYESQEYYEIYGYNRDNDRIDVGEFDKVIISGYTKELVEVEIDSKYTITCTPDHLFMMRDGRYVKASELSYEDSLMSTDSIDYDRKHEVSKVTRVSLDEEVPVYDIVNASHSNFAVALDECTGVFVHNSGKSMILINEGVNAAKQGFDVLHIFIGDMVEYDGFIRYLSCVSGTPQNSLVMMTQERQMEVVKICNQQYNDVFNRVFMLAYPSLSLTVDAMIEDINKFEKQLNKDFGMIIIDYPDNLILDGRSLYEDGGTLYSSLERLARLSQSVVLTASQPQKAYWNHSIIPLEAAAESSKKQQAVDVMLTFNTEMRGANFGTMLLAKARKGEAGKLFRVQTDFARCKLDEVDEATYNVLKSSYGVVQ